MSENLRLLPYMFVNNPLVVCGLLLIGLSGCLAMHMQLKIVRSGGEFPYGKWITRRGHEVAWDYLKAGRLHNWSPWPAYMMWPAAFLGVACLILGLFRLR